MIKDTFPLILAPAGNKASFLAALAARADAVYCGLKSFSARMEAKNFSMEELAGLTELAHQKGTEVYVAFNSLLKPGDMDAAGKLLDELNRRVKPDALIIQDLSLLELAEQTGFKGKIHLSTLAAVTFPQALNFLQSGFSDRIARVVLPRELGIDEIKLMASACPAELEVFVHGALCYGISGRCYWSSFLGGKSGLRGRCVQPCRRFYTQTEVFEEAPSVKTFPKKQRPHESFFAKERRQDYKRFFSCQDLSLDVLVKVLLPVPQIRTWKIEGRKKGPHYVFYTVTAYRMLRDQGNDPEMKKKAMELLSYALGRTCTHYHFLPQRPQNPVNINIQTGSGLFVGNLKGTKEKPYLIPREELLPGDLLRIGYEDESGHGIHRVGRYVPKKGRLQIPLGPPLQKGETVTPVFLTDRREKSLENMLSELESELQICAPRETASDFRVRFPKNTLKKQSVIELHVSRTPEKAKTGSHFGLWLTKDTERLFNSQFSILNSQFAWLWLPPVIWPDESQQWKSLIDAALKKGAKNFVLNAPCQRAFFPQAEKLSLWAGPFCNIANALAAKMLAKNGFSGIIVSPELGSSDYLQLPKQCPLPLGIVLSGNWPLCVSRVLSEDMKTKKLFTSPKGEQAWAEKHESDFRIYPNWKLDISEKKAELRSAGYSLFVHLNEPVPEEITLKKRPGMWNWDEGVL
ncbi:MAG: peptidase U32 [Desulfobacteraceae bacterium IS3]|nr:MAG: peptidase U32 [Desulfobacteraceae bacterium IS3]